MAIIKGMHGVCVEVAVNGVALQEYDDDEDSELDSVTKYIPATSGACFHIQYCLEKTFRHIHHPLSIIVKVDGKHAESRIVLLSAMPTPPLPTKKIEGRRTKAGSDWVIEKFTFSSLVIDDTLSKRAQAGVPADVASLGLISVSLYRLKNLHVQPDVASDWPKFNEIGKVSEKQLKGRALSHAVQLAEAQRIRKVPVYACEHIDKSPFATFNFKYRSLKALKELYIIPRSPSPVPLERRPLETLSPAELLELARKQKEQLERKTAANVKPEGVRSVKREQDRSDDTELSIIDTRPRKAARNSHGSHVEVVDLT